MDKKASHTMAEKKQLLLKRMLSCQHSGPGSDLAAIPPTSRADVIPLSFGQQRLWFLDQLDPGRSTYNVPVAFHVVGHLDSAALERSLQRLVERHESLRTTFVADHTGQLQQLIDTNQTVQVHNLDFSCLPEEARHVAVSRRVDEEAQRPFELSQGPLMRSTLLSLSITESVFVLVIHHIIIDGWSFGVLFCELSALYEEETTGKSADLPTLSVQYADYAVWQRGWLTDERLETQLAYWRGRLSETQPLLELPTDRPRRGTQSYKGAVEFFCLPLELARKARDVASRSGVTPFMLLLSCFSTLLFRWTGQEDIVVGTPVSGRSWTETEGMVGFFPNTLAIRSILSKTSSFLELLRQTRENCLGAFAHQDVPFERLVEELEVGGSVGHNPLFQVAFTYEQGRSADLRFHQCETKPYPFTWTSSKFDLSLAVDDNFECRVEYNTDLFESATIRRFGGHFRTLLAAALNNTGAPLGSLPLLTIEERNELLFDFNDTARPYPHYRCIHQLFEEQVERTPGAIAVAIGDEQITYAQLNARSNHLARHLRSLGVGPEVLVGVCMANSIELIIGLLGIWKAGGAYVPLDPDLPSERISLILADVRPAVVLTQKALLKNLPSLAPSALCLDTDEHTLRDHGGNNLDSLSCGQNLAYVIYTSGSAGKPKGVAVTHISITNNLCARQRDFQLSSHDRVMGTYSYCFDPSVWVFFWPLIAGCQLVLTRPDDCNDIRYLVSLIRQHQITVWGLVPSLLRLLLLDGSVEACSTLRHVFCGGEDLPVDVAEAFCRLSSAWLHNFYGPTEVTIDASYWTYAGNQSGPTAPVGTPLANQRVYILDENFQPVPIGVSGELFVAGDGLARGYLNAPDLTAEKFVPDMFSTVKGGRLYRTGDSGRYRSDGTIDFLGRLDEQVKIRGYRVEPGEVEFALSAHPSVRDSVVIVRDGPFADRSLVAYVVVDGGYAAVHALRRWLQGRLPQYMVPSAFVCLDAIPLTPNGKTDRKMLPAPERNQTCEGSVPPRSSAEKLLCDIWSDVLRMDKVGIRDDFFELGGHSLLATQVISRVRTAFQVDLPLRVIFEFPTVESLILEIGHVWGSHETVDEIARIFREVKDISHEESDPRIAS